MNEPTAPKPAKKAKNPVYAVFVENEHKSLDCMSAEVVASSRKNAIKKAVEDNGGKPEGGRFLVVPAGALSWHARKTRTETVEEFD